jgi:hypothetical protein
MLCWLVIVRFKAIGNAPLLKQTKFKITSTESFRTIMDFLRKQLKFQAHESLVSHPTSNRSSSRSADMNEHDQQ